MNKILTFALVGIVAVLAAAYAFYAFDGSSDDVVYVYATSDVKIVEIEAETPRLPVYDEDFGWPYYRAREDFESTIEKLFYRRFFSLFNYADMLEKSTEVNHVMTYGNFEMEVLRAVAFASEPFYVPVWSENLSILEINELEIGGVICTKSQH